MPSLLIITSVEKLQNEINAVVTSFGNLAGIYVSLNKTQQSAEIALNKSGVKTNKLFFIDCVATEQKGAEVIQIKPSELDTLQYSINVYINEIKGEKFLVIDSLATLLLFNDRKKVARFVKQVTEFATQKDVEIVALSQSITGEDLLHDVFNFFDTVEQKKK